MTTEGGRLVTLRPGDVIAIDGGRVSVVRIDRRDGASVRLRLEFPPEVSIGEVQRRDQAAEPDGA